MSHTLVASFSFALLVTIVLLVREVRFRRALQKLLHRQQAVEQESPPALTDDPPF